jgi:hypothetical protein
LPQSGAQCERRAIHRRLRCDATGRIGAKRRQLSRARARRTNENGTQNRIDLLLLALSIAVLGQLDELLGLLVILLSLASAAAGTSHCEVGLCVYGCMEWVWKLRVACVRSVRSEEGEGERVGEAERGRE